MHTRRVLAVDLGGTNIRAAVVSAEGELTHRRQALTGAAEGPEAVIGRIAALMDAVCGEAGLGLDAPVGVAAPGPINPRTGVVHFTPNLPDWHEVPLGERLRQLSGRTVRLANDGNCAGLGEARFGVGKGTADLVYLALGTGVGGGVISGGRLIDGANGLGAELGHVVVAMDGPRCTCGGIGCLEAFAAGWAIARDAEVVAGTADGIALQREAGSGPITAGTVAAAARSGDPAARRILDRAGRALGAAIGGFVNIFNPALVVVGGGVAVLGDLLLDPARAAIPDHCFAAQRRGLRLEWSQLGDDTALYGAAALALGRDLDPAN